ncbi:unnamed protein product, partial [Ectocarpus sp. 12 AP-2014]
SCHLASTLSRQRYLRITPRLLSVCSVRTMAGISANNVPFRGRTRRDYTNACTACCTHRLMFCMLVTTLILPLACSTTTASTRHTTGTSAFFVSPSPPTAAASRDARGGGSSSRAIRGSSGTFFRSVTLASTPTG